MAEQALPTLDELADVAALGPEPSAEYLARVDALDNEVREAIHVSNGYQGIPSPSTKHFYASVLYTALITRSAWPSWCRSHRGPINRLSIGIIRQPATGSGSLTTRARKRTWSRLQPHDCCCPQQQSRAILAFHKRTEFLSSLYLTH